DVWLAAGPRDPHLPRPGPIRPPPSGPAEVTPAPSAARGKYRRASPPATPTPSPHPPHRVFSAPGGSQSQVDSGQRCRPAVPPVRVRRRQPRRTSQSRYRNTTLPARPSLSGRVGGGGTLLTLTR